MQQRRDESTNKPFHDDDDDDDDHNHNHNNDGQKVVVDDAFCDSTGAAASPLEWQSFERRNLCICIYRKTGSINCFL